MSVQKYSVVFDSETRRRGRGGRRWAGWTGGAPGGSRTRVANLSRAEKAGLLGMVAVVVIILSVVMTSGQRSGTGALSPQSAAEKTRAALEAGRTYEQTSQTPRPGSTEVVHNIFGGGESGGKAATLLLKDPEDAGKAAPKREPAPPSPRIYEVRRGDTLTRIASRLLGRSSRWKEIADLNPKLNPKNLPIGEKIKIPAR